MTHFATLAHRAIKLGFSTLLVIGLLLALPGQTSALSGGDFDPSRIIDDSVFYNTNTLGVQDIQNFLNAKMPNCDTNGAQSKSYYYNSSTGRINNSSDSWITTSRAVYGQRYNSYNQTSTASAPFTCLKDYRQDIPFTPANTYCGGSISGGNKYASQIIYDVAKVCGINPQVLIVLLQKEQSLITDDWPWQNQYRSATGFGCPDTAACDSAYYGFYNQVYNAAKQFQRYAKLPQSYNYAAGRTSFVSYQANNPGCGGTDIRMQNAATASLYNYTPYQPNQAALNNLYGSGDGCSAYGNRNFWRLFNDWFGSTDGKLSVAHPDGTIVRPANSPQVYKITNGKAQIIPSYGIFKSWGHDFGRLKIATQGDLNLMSASDLDVNHTNNPAPLQLREGAVVKGSGPTIYIVKLVNGTPTKRAVDSWPTFRYLGYDMSDVITIPDNELPAQDGSPINSATTTHPDGALVRVPGSPTVYLIIGGERHALPSLAIFASHGHSMASVKTATTGDANLPVTWPINWLAEGALIRGSGPTVYIIQNTNVKRVFSYYAFVGLDYRFGEVMQISDGEVPSANGTPVGQ